MRQSSYGQLNGKVADFHHLSKRELSGQEFYDRFQTYFDGAQFNRDRWEHAGQLIDRQLFGGGGDVTFGGAFTNIIRSFQVGFTHKIAHIHVYIFLDLKENRVN